MISKFYLIFIFCLSFTESQYRLGVQLEPENLKTNDSVIVSCVVYVSKYASLVSSPSFSPDSVSIVWMQKIKGKVEIKDNEDINEKEIKIGRNAELFENYKNSDKYEIIKPKVDSNKEKIIYELKIKDLKPIDSGSIGCQLNFLSTKIFRPLVVHEPPKKIFFKSKNKEETEARIHFSGENLYFSEDEIRKFIFYVEETYPIPEIKIKIGNDDITHLFIRQTTVDLHGSPNFGTLYYFTLIAENFKLIYPYNNQLLTIYVKQGLGCGSSGGEIYRKEEEEEKEDEEKEVGEEEIGIVKKNFCQPLFTNKTSIKIKLSKYKPKFKCEKIENNIFFAHLHQNKVKISCNLSSKPAASKVFVFWKNFNGKKIVINDGEKQNNFQFYFKNQTINFYIEHLFPQYFSEFNFKAYNSHGHSTFKFKVQQKYQSSGFEYLRSGVQSNNLNKIIFFVAMVTLKAILV